MEAAEAEGRTRRQPPAVHAGHRGTLALHSAPHRRRHRRRRSRSTVPPRLERRGRRAPGPAAEAMALPLPLRRSSPPEFGLLRCRKLRRDRHSDLPRR